jgi:glutamyl-tRNA synthetase
MAMGDCAMRGLQRGDIIQLERRGFFRVDSVYLSEHRPMVLFSIPDGKGGKGGSKAKVA